MAHFQAFSIIWVAGGCWLKMRKFSVLVQKVKGNSVDVIDECMILLKIISKQHNMKIKQEIEINQFSYILGQNSRNLATIFFSKYVRKRANIIGTIFLYFQMCSHNRYWRRIHLHYVVPVSIIPSLVFPS